MAYSNAGNEYHKAGPNLAVLPLQKEDRVWVRHYSCQCHYSGGPKTTFFQISPLIQSLNNMRWGKELSHRILEFLIKWSYMCVELVKLLAFIWWFKNFITTYIIVFKK